MKKLLPLALIGVLTLSACDNMGQKESGGMVIGGAAGALAGSQVGGGNGRIVATAIGALLGAAVGSSVGSSLDDLDRMKAQQAFNQAATTPVGRAIAWNNPQSGHSGTVLATRDGTSNKGEYCREFQTTVVVGGKQESAYGTACRKPDGSWQMDK